MSLLTEIRIPDKNVLSFNYYVLLETHIPFLRSHKSTQLVEINGQIAEKYTGDFYGLLDELNIDKKYQYLICRVNGMNTSTDYDGLRKSFYIPGIDAMSGFISTYNSHET